jgi:hypothetical protein
MVPSYPGRQVSLEDPGVRPGQLRVVQGAGGDVFWRGVEVRRHRVGVRLLRPERQHFLVSTTPEQVRSGGRHPFERGRLQDVVAVRRAPATVREPAVTILVG